jgi:hypothetical protein
MFDTAAHLEGRVLPRARDGPQQLGWALAVDPVYPQ